MEELTRLATMARKFGIDVDVITPGEILEQDLYLSRMALWAVCISTKTDSAIRLTSQRHLPNARVCLALGSLRALRSN